MMKTPFLRPLAAFLALSMAGAALAASPQAPGYPSGLASHGQQRNDVLHVVPSARTLAPQNGLLKQEVRTTGVQARIELLGSVARTTLEIALHNPGARDVEAKLLLPLPRGAAVVDFDFEGAALEPTAELLDVDQARSTYRSIVSRLQDPALLEFAGTALLRSSVFPVPAGGRQAVRVVFEHVLEGGQAYLLPRSERLTATVPWTLEVHAAEGHVYSPSHALEVVPGSSGRVLRSRTSTALQPGPIRILHLVAGHDPLASTLLAHPDPQGGGHFLLVATPPPMKSETGRIPRSVTFVIDRSGSMAGGKLAQAIAGVRRLAASLGPEESFNVIDYGSQVARFAPRPVAATPETQLRLAQYLSQLRPAGGTNLAAGLALGLESTAGVDGQQCLPLLILLSDGVPTVGERRATELRAQVEKRTAKTSTAPRLFTVGIGHDVDAPLLDGLAADSRAVPTYILPGEDVALRMDELTRKLHGPRWAGLTWEVRDEQGQLIEPLVDVHPHPLPDVFAGDALVLLGRYTHAGRWRASLRGMAPDGTLEVSFPIDFRGEGAGGRASVLNSFVPRLWAYREIAFLVDQLRGGGPLGAAAEAELREEVLRLSTQYGVLSEYTAFLATEGTDLGNWNELVRGVESNLLQAAKPRSGEWAVNQSRNMLESRSKAQVDYRNGYWDKTGRRQESSGVQQLADGAFLSSGQPGHAPRWVDARLVLAGMTAQEPAKVLLPGEPAYEQLLVELEREGRSAWLSLEGDVLLARGQENWLVRNGQRW